MGQPELAEPAESLAPSVPTPDDRYLLARRPEIVVLAAIVLFALVVRLFNLGTFPDTLNPDEADNAQDALRILYGNPPRGTFAGGFFGLDWTRQPAFSAYLLAGTLGILGESVTSIRLLSAIVSSLALIPFFFLVRRQFSAISSLLATFLLACNLWYLNFSRSGWNNIYICFFMLMAMLLFLLALDRLQGNTIQNGKSNQLPMWLLFGATGVFCALGLYGYPGGRNVLLSLLVFLPFALLRFKRQAWKLVSGYALLVAVTAVLFFPQLQTIVSQWERYNGRSSAVLITNSPQFKLDPVGIMASQVSKNVLGFWYGPANKSIQTATKRYMPPGEAMLDTVTGLLMLAGIVLSLVRVSLRRRYDTWLWWLMFLVSWAATELITRATPDGARGIGWLPTLFFFVAAGIEGLVALLNLGGRAVRRSLTPRLGAAVSTVAVVATGLYNIYHYSEWQQQAGTKSARAPYVEVENFAIWHNDIVNRAQSGEKILTVSDWRAQRTEASMSQTLTMSPFTPPDTAREDWPTLLLTVGKGQGESSLSEPRAVAVDTSGNIYVVDSDPTVQAIKKYDKRGNFLLSWGRPGAADSNDKFENAWAVVISKEGEVLVLDEANSQVRVFSSDGKFLRRWETLADKPTYLYHPRAMAIDSKDRVYIADTGHRRLLVFDNSGNQLKEYSVKAGLPAADWDIEPGGVAVALNDRFFLGAAIPSHIRAYDSEGRQQQAWGFAKVKSALLGPRLAVAPDGTLYAVAPDTCMFVHYSPYGETLGSGGDCTDRDYLDKPGGISVSQDGKIYLTDLGHKAVHVFAPSDPTPGGGP